MDLNDLVKRLRATGGDSSDVEVKSAAGGLPQSLTSTLSALANLPVGGTIILGLDEATGFRPVPLTDPQQLKQGLAGKARSFTPPVRLTIEDGTVEGAHGRRSAVPGRAPAGMVPATRPPSPARSL